LNFELLTISKENWNFLSYLLKENLGESDGGKLKDFIEQSHKEATSFSDALLKQPPLPNGSKLLVVDDE